MVLGLLCLCFPPLLIPLLPLPFRLGVVSRVLGVVDWISPSPRFLSLLALLGCLFFFLCEPLLVLVCSAENDRRSVDPPPPNPPYFPLLASIRVYAGVVVLEDWWEDCVPADDVGCCPRPTVDVSGG